MATLEIGSSSSHCSDCRKAGRNSNAKATEDGHFTLLGYGPDNGQPGCGAEWDSVTVGYYNGSENSTQMLQRLKYGWGYAKNVPDDNWNIFTFGRD